MLFDFTREAAQVEKGLCASKQLCSRQPGAFSLLQQYFRILPNATSPEF